MEDIERASEEPQEQDGDQEELTDREEGGPTSPDEPSEDDVTGGGQSPKPEGGFDSHE
ncbi:MAG: hypothetical protein ABR581_01205 [Thermoleophilaceae bacterium]